jgi:hypothetical protein
MPRDAPIKGISSEIPINMANNRAKGTFITKKIGVRVSIMNSPSNNWLRKKF